MDPLVRLYQLLAVDAGLAALIGGRLAEGSRPQRSAYPSLNFRRVSNQWPSASHSGPGALQWMRVQFEAWSREEASEAREVMAALRVALGKIDLTAAITSPAAVVTKDRHTYLMQLSDEWKDPEPVIYRELLDVKIWFKQ